MIEFRLKEMLAKNNMTMADINKKTGISKNALSQLASGTSKGIQFHTLEKIIEALKVPIEDLIVYIPNSQKNIKFSFDLNKATGGVIVPVFSESIGGSDEESAFEYIDNIRFVIHPLEVLIEADGFTASFNLTCDIQLIITESKELDAVIVTTNFPKSATELLSVRFDSYDFREAFLEYITDLASVEFSEYVNDFYPSEFVLNGDIG